ncbi:type II toxin-antitoxin system death-on-curing family toxin [Cellulomonas sp.]|uniref:type II toxin-antitoxin system death-on-curing family toxin n=1 Tax=Cellulomonas sp. TaxID=40001 RepID=UPI003BABB831
MSEYLYPTLDTASLICEVLSLHVRDPGALASALERPAQIVWGVEAYVGLDAKAAALLDAVNRSHALIDGNKRLSWLLVARFYDLFGWDLVVDAAEGDRFIREVGGDHVPLSRIAEWLHGHARER